MESHALSPAGSHRGVFPLRLPAAGDERLATLIARGDDAAFRHLYDRYHQPLYRYCRSLLHHDADAQDALQSTFTAAYMALRHSRRNAPMRPWLFRIAHNEAVSLLRRRRPDQELTGVHEAGTTTLEEHVEERERLALLVSDLRELPESQRSALVMRELSGLSHAEIAMALELSPNAAKQTIFAARKSLAELAEGRAMSCDEICRLVSDADGRVLRSRKVGAHLRDCRACAAFAAAIPARSSQLRALAPALPALAAGGIFGRIAAGGSGHGGSQGLGLAATGAGKAVSTAVLVKSATVAAVVAATATAGLTGAFKHHSSTPHSASTSAAGLHSAATAAHSPITGTAPTSNAAAGRSGKAKAIGSIAVRGRRKHPGVASVVSAGVAGATHTAKVSLAPLKSGRGASAPSQHAAGGHVGGTHAGNGHILHSVSPGVRGSHGAGARTTHTSSTRTSSSASSSSSHVRHVHSSSSTTTPRLSASPLR